LGHVEKRARRVWGGVAWFFTSYGGVLSVCGARSEIDVQIDNKRSLLLAVAEGNEQ